MMEKRIKECVGVIFYLFVVLVVDGIREIVAAAADDEYVSSITYLLM